MISSFFSVLFHSLMFTVSLHIHLCAEGFAVVNTYVLIRYLKEKKQTSQTKCECVK